MRQLRIGCHVSIRYGYLAGAQYAHNCGARSFQFFAKNPRMIAIKSWDVQDAEACAIYCLQHNLTAVIHSSYPVNLAVPYSQKQELIVQCLLNDLHIADACGAVGVVVHFGQYKGKDPLQAYLTVVHNINEVLHKWSGKALILLENQAGQGTHIGLTLEELLRTREVITNNQRVGFCLDTCHAFTAGIWNTQATQQFMWEVEESGFHEHIQAIHFNDSVYPAKSKRDRHAQIRQGRIGLDNMLMFCQPHWVRQVPFILETPKGEDGSHRSEINFLKNELNITPSSG